MTKKKDNTVEIEFEADTERLQDVVDIMKDVNDTKPNITIRDNEQVYVTINNFNETEKEYSKVMGDENDE